MLHAPTQVRAPFCVALLVSDNQLECPLALSEYLDLHREHERWPPRFGSNVIDPYRDLIDTGGPLQANIERAMTHGHRPGGPGNERDSFQPR
jgi:hypothetical protein